MNVIKNFGRLPKGKEFSSEYGVVEKSYNNLDKVRFKRNKKRKYLFVKDF